MADSAGALGGAGSRTRALAAILFLTVLTFFFVSGACGLLYQVVWTRRLVLVFGATSYAVSTVLSIFFLGLALGSWWGGRLADRSRRPLFIYGVFEILIALWAVIFVLSIGRGEGFLVGLLRETAQWRPAAIGIRAVLALVLLIVPVTLMGATLPILARFVAARSRFHGFRIGALYGVNTLGAVTGCALAGFYLLPNFGYSATTWFGAAANAAVGVMALLLSGVLHESSALSDEKINSPTPGSLAPDRRAHFNRSVVTAAFALSGFCALALEVLWTRLLAVLFVGTTYAFTTMLVAILCGIAAGSIVAAAVADRIKRPIIAFGIVEVVLAAACLWMLPAFAGMPERLIAWQTDGGWDWEAVVRATFLASFSVLFVPTFLFGATFPIVVRAVTSGKAGLGRSIGRIYSANTLGGVFGAVAGGYLLIPLLGTHNGIVVTAGLLALTGLALIVVSTERAAAFKASAAVMGIVLVVSGFRAGPDDVALALNRGYVPANHVVLRQHEGVEGTVVVSGPEDSRSQYNRILWINAIQATQSIEKGVKMNRFQGVLPLLFDREPNKALFMCFGSGITAGTLARTSLQHIDAVEIAKDVLDAAPLFGELNFDVIENPKVRFVIDDGRNFLLTTEERYDVITFEPMPLALTGVSAFYTKEYYRLCLNKLAPGGLVSQWVPLHSLHPDIVRSLVATFTDVFPEYCAWFVNADLFLIGSDAAMTIDYSHADAIVNDSILGPALLEVGFPDAAELIASFVMDKTSLKAFGDGAPIMSDDRPWAEFEAPKWVYDRNVQESLAHLRRFVRSPVGLLQFEGLDDNDAAGAKTRVERRFAARLHDLEGLEQYYGGTILGKVDRAFKTALDTDPDDATARYYLREISLQRIPLFIRWDEYDEGLAYIADMLPYLPDFVELYLFQGDLYQERGDFEKARQSYARYRELGGTARGTDPAGNEDGAA